MRYEISEDVAEKVAVWILTREGAQVWENVDLSGPMHPMMRPQKDPDGKLNEGPPDWRCGKMIKLLSRLEDVTVQLDKEVHRFRVAVRVGGSFRMKLKLTDASQRKLDKALLNFQPEHCTGCEWKGHHKDLKSRKTQTASWYICPECKSGDGLETLKARAFHRFDYETQEAVILVPSEDVPLEEWVRQKDLKTA